MEILILFIVSANLAVSLMNFYMLTKQKRERDEKEALRRQEALCEDELTARNGSAEELAARAEREKEMADNLDRLMSYQASLGHGKKTGGAP